MEVLIIFIFILVMMASLGIGFPVGFALPGAAIISLFLAAIAGIIFEGNPNAYFAYDGPIEWINAGITNFRGTYWDNDRDTLIAIPLFIFMGLILQRSRIAEDLLMTMGKLFGRAPGGLGISVVLVGGLLAATTGIVGATVIAMGLISLPAMLKNNYDKNLATGIISASGTLGQIIPPSIVLIIVADQISNAADAAQNIRLENYKFLTGESTMPGAYNVTSTSAGELFLGAILPGLILVLLYVTYVFVRAIINPKLAPPVPSKTGFDKRLAIEVASSLLPPILLIVLVLGSILYGVATVNQAGAVGAVGAVIMAGYKLYNGQKHKYTPTIIATTASIIILIMHYTIGLNIKNIENNNDWFWVLIGTLLVFSLLFSITWSFWRVFKIKNVLKEVSTETTLTSTMVFIILIGAALLTAAFRGLGGEDLIRDYLKNLPGGFWTQFFVVMLIIFILGFFIDYIEIVVVVLPIVAPILLADPSANITAIWLGVMVGVNMQTSFLTPPFGFALFYLRGVAPKSITTADIWKGATPFIFLQLGGLLITGLYPSLSNYIPFRSYLTSDLAPPSTNPKLEKCLMDYTYTLYRNDETKIRKAIAEARTYKMDILPSDQRSLMNDHFTKSLLAMDQIKIAEKKKNILDEYSKSYSVLHNEVRKIQIQANDIDKKIIDLQKDLERLKDENKKNILRKQIDKLSIDRDKILSTISKDFEEKNKKYKELSKDYKISLDIYYKTVDQGYDNFFKIFKEIKDVEKIKLAQEELKIGIELIQKDNKEKSIKSFLEILEIMDKTSGGDEIKDIVYETSERMKENWNKKEILRKAQDVQKLLQKELTLRDRSAKELLVKFETYNKEIVETLGVRKQERIPRKHALYVSKCTASHEDISLNF